MEVCRRLCGCGNTCVLYLDAMVPVGEKPEEKKIPTIALTEIKVPTLITMENDHDILSLETLDLKDAKVGYIVKELGQSEEIIDAEKPIRYNRVVIPRVSPIKLDLPIVLL